MRTHVVRRYGVPAVFATESTRDGLADAPRATYDGVATRLVLYNALAGGPERTRRYGEVARMVSR